jgi:hypothetical protein
MDHRAGAGCGTQVRNTNFRPIVRVCVLISDLSNSQETLQSLRDAPGSSSSSLTALPKYKVLYRLVSDMQRTLPPSMNLLKVSEEVRRQTWKVLKDRLNE